MDRANPRSPAVIRFRPPVRSYPEQPSYPEQLPLPGAPSSFNWSPSSQLSPTTLSPTSPAAASSPGKPSRLLGSPVSSGWQPTLAPVGFRPRPTPGCLWQRPVPTAPQHEDPPAAPRFLPWGNGWKPTITYYKKTFFFGERISKPRIHWASLALAQ